MDPERAHNTAVRHRLYRVVLACVVAVLLTSTVVHLWSFWNVWKVTVVIGVAAVAGLLASGVVLGRRSTHQPDHGRL